MFGDPKDTQKNLKDSEIKSMTSYGTNSQNTSFLLSYKKTDKLVTALYMVTDMVDKDEPLRNKLRTLSVEIISDINTRPLQVCARITEIVSFLDIAGTVNIISSMNCNILKKEFLELDKAIKESNNLVGGLISKQIDLSEFLREELPAPSRQIYKSIGHHKSTRIGVQKGHTLMKALSDRISVGGSLLSDNKSINENKQNFEDLKTERRNEIVKVIRNYPNGATITDIKIGAQGALMSCSEKTIQRELISMVKDNVLNKTGEKRWSRYFITPPAGFNLLQDN